jgi:hypothetical protein
LLFVGSCGRLVDIDDRQFSLRRFDLESQHILTIVGLPLGLAFGDDHGIAHRFNAQTGERQLLVAIAYANDEASEGFAAGSLASERPWRRQQYEVVKAEAIFAARGRAPASRSRRR